MFNGNRSKKKFFISIFKNIFSYLCIFGYIETAKWCHSLGGVDIHIENDFAFRQSCEDGHHKKFTK